MAQAKTLKAEEFQQVVAMLNDVSDRVMFDKVALCLSFKGALRACEIAGLSWRDVTDVFSKVRNDEFQVPNAISKYGKGRLLPMHPDTYAALVELKASMPKEKTLGNMPILPDGYGKHQKPNTVVQRLKRLYGKMGLDGVSSHSGRRTCLTTMSRRANNYKCSLRDVQIAAGHSSLKTTECYLEASEGLGDLMRSV